MFIQPQAVAIDAEVACKCQNMLIHMVPLYQAIGEISSIRSSESIHKAMVEQHSVQVQAPFDLPIGHSNPKNRARAQMSSLRFIPLYNQCNDASFQSEGIGFSPVMEFFPLSGGNLSTYSNLPTAQCCTPRDGNASI